MSEYIEKEIVVDYLNHKLRSKCQDLEGWTSEECKHCLATEAIYSIKMTNAASVAPIIRGKWEPIEDDPYPDGNAIDVIYRCSNCGRRESDNDENFCPNCGAAMNEEAAKIISERNKHE